MKGVNIDDPIMKEFVDNLDVVNGEAEKSEGFIWRLTDEEDNATSFDPYHNVRIIINVSVWKDVDSLKNFIFKGSHLSFMRRRKEWFEKFGKAYFCMWRIEAGKVPTIEEAVDRLDHFQKHGSSDYAFDFKKGHSHTN
jgi:hypothetical protein